MTIELRRVELTQNEQINILVDRIQVLEDGIKMLSYNLRCLNIRQGSQPIELSEKQAETVFIAEGPMDQMEVFNPENATFDLSGITALDYMFKLGQRQPDIKLPDIDFDHPCTPDEFENMVDTLVINEDRRYQYMINFGADETVWAK